MGNISLILYKCDEIGKLTITSNLVYDSRGEEVKILQRRLHKLGFYNKDIDGWFGPFTLAGVKNFQLTYGIYVDGIVGPVTTTALNQFSAADSGTDVTGLVQKIKWGGRKGSSARNVHVTLLDDDGANHARSNLDIEEGIWCVFKTNGTERFRGLVMEQTQTNKKRLDFTAYDDGIRLANNRDTFSYENWNASSIFRDVCKRFNLPVGTVDETSYIIPELSKPKSTGWDVIQDALSLDYDATGIRHFVSCVGGKMCLMERRKNIQQWVFETGGNIEGFTATKSIENMRTRVKLISKEGTTVAEKTLPEWENKIGMFQEIDTPDEEMTAAQINELIDSILEEKGTPKRTVDIETVGIDEVISGIGVYLIIPELGISRSYYVDSDTHVYEDGHHTMSLKLNYAGDFSKEVKKTVVTEQPKTYHVGDVVYFKGGYHYESSYSYAKGYLVGAGPARIMMDPNCALNGGAHPWNLITTDWSKTHVYGWVDEGSFE